MNVGEKVNSNKKTAIIVGVLFIVATITYASGSAMIEPFLGNSGGIATPLVIGSLLEFIDVIAVIIIGVLLFPILKNYSILIAWTYLGTRILEAAFLSVSIASIFLTTALWYERAFQIAFLVLGLGSLPFVYLLYKSKLIPRSISVIGFIGYIALLVWSVLEVSGYTTGMFLFIPGALFEIIFPIWLIVKGFNLSTLVPQSAKADN